MTNPPAQVSLFAHDGATPQKTATELHARMMAEPIPPGGLQPKNMNVLLGRGKSYAANEGNVWFQDIIEEAVPTYYTEKSIQIKRYITWCIVCRILQEGDGFLRWNKHCWERVPLDDQRQKVAHALQYKIRALVKEEQRKENRVVAGQKTGELRKGTTKFGSDSRTSDSSQSYDVGPPAVGRAFARDSIGSDMKPAARDLQPPRKKQVTKDSTYNPWPQAVRKEKQQRTGNVDSQRDLEGYGVVVARKRHQTEKQRGKDPPVYFYAVSSSHDLWSDELVSMNQQPTNVLSDCLDS